MIQGEPSVLKKVTKLQSIGLFHNGTPKPVDFDRVTLFLVATARGTKTWNAFQVLCSIQKATCCLKPRVNIATMCT